MLIKVRNVSVNATIFLAFIHQLVVSIIFRLLIGQNLVKHKHEKAQKLNVLVLSINLFQKTKNLLHIVFQIFYS